MSEYAKKSDIPTNVSAFNNDAGYLTEHQSLADYALKTELPTEYVKSATVQGNKLTLTNKDNTTVEFEPSGGGSGGGGTNYTFTDGLTETDGVVKWNLNDKIKTNDNNVIFIGNIPGNSGSMGDGCVVFGKDTYSHTTFKAEGNGCICGGNINSMRSLGINTIGRGNLAFGYLDGAVKIAVGGNGSGYGSVGIGAVTDTSGNLLVSGNCGQAFGFGVQSLSNYQMVHGKDNISDSNSTYAHIVGNGTSDSARSNAYTLDWQGNGTFAGTVSSSSGADYAEYFEWKDGNPNNEDRVGYIVTLDGDKIVKANTGDDILGICSGTAMVLGDSAEWNWSKRYLTDDFGRIIYEDYDVEHEEIKNEETGEVIEEAWTEHIHAPKQNPEYDASQPYVKRADRPEWQIVGMMGKLYVRDDGSCIVNGYADVKDGIATKANGKTNMRVMERITDNIVRVLMK